jgi:hypothetical protein
LRADVDELRVRQALGNLLDNGCAPCPSGGVSGSPPSATTVRCVS